MTPVPPTPPLCQQEGLRTLRVGDESTVMRIDDDPIPAHQVRENAPPLPFAAGRQWVLIFEKNGHKTCEIEDYFAQAHASKLRAVP